MGAEERRGSSQGLVPKKSATFDTYRASRSVAGGLLGALVAAQPAIAYEALASVVAMSEAQRKVVGGARVVLR